MNYLRKTQICCVSIYDSHKLYCVSSHRSFRALEFSSRSFFFLIFSWTSSICRFFIKNFQHNYMKKISFHIKMPFKSTHRNRHIQKNILYDVVQKIQSTRLLLSHARIFFLKKRVTKWKGIGASSPSMTTRLLQAFHLHSNLLGLENLLFPLSLDWFWMKMKI